MTKPYSEKVEHFSFEFLQTATTPETFFCFSLEVIKSHENTPQFAHRPGNLCCCKMLREQSGLGSKNTPETNVYIYIVIL